MAKNARKLLRLDAKDENYIVEVDLPRVNRKDIEPLLLSVLSPTTT